MGHISRSGPVEAAAEHVLIRGEDDGVEFAVLVAPVGGRPYIRINVGGRVVVMPARKWHEAAIAAASETQRHVHTCMSCSEAWFCPHQPGDCTAPPKVMPSLILRGPSGPTVFHHDCKGKK